MSDSSALCFAIAKFARARERACAVCGSRKRVESRFSLGLLEYLVRFSCRYLKVELQTLPNSIFPSRNITQIIHLGILRPSLLGLFRFPFSTRCAERRREKLSQTL